MTGVRVSPGMLASLEAVLRQAGAEGLSSAELLEERAILLRTLEDHRQASREAAAAYRALEAERDALRADAEKWRSLYRRAINEANGLTNYVEERPELRRAERQLEAIQLEARAIDAAMKGTQ